MEMVHSQKELDLVAEQQVLIIPLTIPRSGLTFQVPFPHDYIMNIGRQQHDPCFIQFFFEAGSAARSSDGNRGRQAQPEGNPSSGMQMPNMMNPPNAQPIPDEVPDVYPDVYPDIHHIFPAFLEIWYQS